MIYFPQLSTGTTSQLPLRWTDQFPALSNQFMDGSVVTADAEALSGVAWDLTFDGLNEAERGALQSFFESARGALNSFTMIDPADNLLAFSEDFTQACWAHSGLVAVTPGASDPFGGKAAMTIVNTAEAAQQLLQQVPAPASYSYCFSIYARSDSPQTISLVTSTDSSTVEQPVTTATDWRRFALTFPSGTAGGGVSFGIEAPAGVRVQIFGAQAEAQPGAGTYKQTGSTNAVYENCRLDQDELAMTATGPGAYRCQMRIRNTGPLPW